MPAPRLAAPLVLVNYKVYAEATGEKAVALTRALEAAAAGSRATVAVAPQAVDLARVKAATRLPVLAQHVDALPPGAGTGWVLPEAARDAGAMGSLVNHAEHQLPDADVARIVLRLAALGLASVVCTKDVPATRVAAALKPSFVAIEPPELIGGDVSVTSADPGIVKDAVAAARAADPTARVLCGAGVKTGEDLAAALALGCEGVLLASGVVKAKDPKAALAALLGPVR